MPTYHQKISFRVKFYIVLAVIIIHLLFSLNYNGSFILNGKLKNVETYQDIEAQSIFNFSIFSDNHGVSPYENLNFAKANYHIRKTNDVCVLGVGDHLTGTGTNDFLYFICNDPYWRANFYPTISDNENAFYGSSQNDWGAGKEFFNAMDFHQKNNLTFSKEQVDYYAIIEAPKNYKIHWISLYFPDHPEDPRMAFRESSKLFLRRSLSQIVKTHRDIIVIGAHSKYGSWIQELSPDLQKVVMEKADIIVGASTHFYERYQLDGYQNHGPLLLNSGSPVYPRFGSKPGFLQVHVMENHRGLYVNYVDVSKPTMLISSSPNAYFKSFEGDIYELYYPTIL
jgi:hypothetical protein